MKTFETGSEGGFAISIVKRLCGEVVGFSCLKNPRDVISGNISYESIR